MDSVEKNQDPVAANIALSIRILKNEGRREGEVVEEFEQEAPTENGEIVDGFLLAALKNQKDRILLMKLDLDLERFILALGSNRLEFPPMNPYHRRIVHRAAAYFKLDHVLDQKKQSVVVYKNSESRVPVLRFSDLCEEEEDKPLKPLKIMKRSEKEKGEENEAKANLDPSPTASPPPAAEKQQSPPPSSQQIANQQEAEKKTKSIEEREEHYMKARARIFGKTDSLEEGAKPGVSAQASIGTKTVKFNEEPASPPISPNLSSSFSNDSSLVNDMVSPSLEPRPTPKTILTANSSLNASPKSNIPVAFETKPNPPSPFLNQGYYANPRVSPNVTPPNPSYSDRGVWNSPPSGAAYRSNQVQPGYPPSNYPVNYQPNYPPSNWSNNSQFPPQYPNTPPNRQRTVILPQPKVNPSPIGNVNNNRSSNLDSSLPINQMFGTMQISGEPSTDNFNLIPIPAAYNIPSNMNPNANPNMNPNFDGYNANFNQSPNFNSNPNSFGHPMNPNIAPNPVLNPRQVQNFQPQPQYPYAQYPSYMPPNFAPVSPQYNNQYHGMKFHSENPDSSSMRPYSPDRRGSKGGKLFDPNAPSFTPSSANSSPTSSPSPNLSPSQSMTNLSSNSSNNNLNSTNLMSKGVHFENDQLHGAVIEDGRLQRKAHEPEKPMYDYSCQQPYQGVVLGTESMAPSHILAVNGLPPDISQEEIHIMLTDLKRMGANIKISPATPNRVMTVFAVFKTSTQASKTLEHIQIQKTNYPFELVPWKN